MIIKKVAMCGTLDSSDVLVTVRPNEKREIFISSSVGARFENEIKKTVEKVLDEQECKNVSITLKDSGALNCVIEARVLTALQRGESND